MPGLAALVFAQVLAASPAEGAARALADLRATYAETLARSDFREDAPAMRALAQSMTPRLLALWEDPGAPRSQVVELMAATGGDDLRPLLEADEGARVDLARAWLRWHDDAALVAAIPEAMRGPALRALALYHPAHAVAPLAAAVRDSNPIDRDGPCLSALRLAPRERRAVLADAVATLVSLAPASNAPACVRLAVEHPLGRRWLTAALLDPRDAARGAEPDRWKPVAAALLVASGPTDPRVGAELARWTTFLRTGADAHWRRELVTALERQSPWWPDTVPARRAPVLALARAAGAEGVRLWPLRRALGDATLFPDAVAALASPAIDPRTLAEAVRVVGLTAPLDPRARAEATGALNLLRSRLRPWAIDSVSPREIDRWRAALDAARPCAGEACAAALATATDATAARMLALGTRADDPAVARSLVRRVATAGEDFVTPDGAVRSPSALAAVALTRAAACPPALRALATTRPALNGRDHGGWLDPWRERYIGRCTAEARRP